MKYQIFMHDITSPQNEQIKNIVKLRQARERKSQGKILIEGIREITMAMAGKIEFEKILFCPDYEYTDEKILKLAGDNLVTVNKKVFGKISARENPDGFLAIAKPKNLTLQNIKLSKNPLIIVLENVEKPGNLGAIARTADAAGVDAIIVGANTDIYNPNAIRASQGTIFTNQIVAVEPAKTIKWLKEKNIKIFATTPRAKIEYTKADYKKPSAIVLGAEDKGLGDIWLSGADENIKINMTGKIDSLNVSVTAAVIIFEAMRQRNN
jgi:RNA methyltransferase, TrmH family